MSRFPGILAILCGVAIGGLVSLSLMPSTLGWCANLAGLLLFVLAVEILVSARRFGTFEEMLAASGTGPRLRLALLGGAAGAVIGALVRLVPASAGLSRTVARAGEFTHVPPSYLVPVYTFAGLFLLLLLADFIWMTRPRWVVFREWMAEDIRAKAALLLVAGAIDVIAVSIVQGRWIYLVPLAGAMAMGGAYLVLDLACTRSRIWAVARHMIAEGIRMKIALIFIGIIVVILPVLPFIVAGDGLTLKSRVQSFLSYSLGSVSFLLSLLTVFLACASISNEISQKFIFMVASKPIPRWQFFVGKWVGICGLDAALLFVAGLTVWVFTAYLQELPTSLPGDREALQAEVLTIRHGMRLEDPPDLVDMVEAEMRRLREEGRLDEMNTRARDELRRSKEEEIRRQWRNLGPMEAQEFVFRGLIIDPKGGGWLQLRFKPAHPGGAADVMFRAAWESGDPRDRNTLTDAQAREFIVDRFHEIVIPAWAVNSEGTLYLRMQNLSEKDTIMFEGDEGFELFYPVGTFHWNLFRALFIVWCRLAFTAVVGLLASSFLSFPVACMACFLVLAVAVGSGFLADAIEGAEVKYSGEDPLWVVGPILRPLARSFVWLVPDFSKFDPVGTVVAGRVVTLKWTLQSLIVLVFLKGLILGVVGCLVLTRRELAQVTT